MDEDGIEGKVDGVYELVKKQGRNINVDLEIAGSEEDNI